MDYLKLIQVLEDQIRKGQIKATLEQVTKLNFEKIPRRFRQRLANLAWRSGGVQQGMHILHPIVRSEEAIARDDATDIEVIEYSMLLQKLGSTTEALQRLQGIDTDYYPQVLLYQVFCMFSTWNYQESIDLLKAYISHKEVTPYNIVVGKTNLLSAYICVGEYEKARKLASQLLHELEGSSHQRLYGNILEMAAQIEIHDQDYKSARSKLSKSIEVLSRESGSYQLFAQKWLSILESMEGGSNKSLYDFRELALGKNHWESVREADLYILRNEFDEDRFHRLLYGTPYEGYRNRILSILSLPDRNFEAQTQISTGEKLGTSFSFSEATLGDQVVLKQGKAIHKLLNALSFDLYKPQRIGTLFSLLYPDEYFDIKSSPNRIHQLVNRTKKEVAKEKLPLSIAEYGGSYKLELKKNSTFVIALQKAMPSMERIYLSRLQKAGLSEKFKVSDVMEVLDLPLTSANRFVKWALGENHIVKQGAGKNTFYELVASNVLRESA